MNMTFIMTGSLKISFDMINTDKITSIGRWWTKQDNCTRALYEGGA